MITRTIATGLALFAFLAVIAHLGCSDPLTPREQAAAGYKAQQDNCVLQYAKRADIDACKAKVRDAWSATDAGKDGDQ